MGKLTKTGVERAKAGDKLSDGGGLRLDVDSSGNRNWVFRFTSPTSGKERYAGLGPARDVTLAAARDAAQAARALIREGKDPIEHRREQRVAAKVEASKAVTFKAYAEQFVSTREGAWKNEKHAKQWRASLASFVYPVIGYLPLADVDTAAVLKVLRPIWQSKPETASRVRGRLESILSAAKVEGLRMGDNPALWRGHIAEILPSKKRTVKHLAALPYSQVPRFMTSLRADETDAALLLRFIVLTAARYQEAALADWSEVNGDVWTCPAIRMKAGKLHTVPLSGAALAVLEIARARYGDSGLIFPGMRDGRPISDVSLTKCSRRHTAEHATTHGMRSSFRDFCGDCTDFPREVAEAALAHAVGDETEAAYRRGNALEKRRKLMDLWAQHCSSAPAVGTD